MNVAIFSSEFYPAKGGLQEVVRQSAHDMIRAGDHPLVVTNRHPKSLPRSETYEGIPVRRHVFRVPEPNFKQTAGAYVAGPVTLLMICHQLLKHRTELIHIQCVSSNAYYAVRAKQRLGVPLVLSLHGELTGDHTGLFQRSDLARRIMRSAIDNAEIVTACSRHTLREAEAFYGRPLGSRGRVVYSGVRVEEIRDAEPYPHPRPYVLAIGRLVRTKGFAILLRAFVEVLRQNDTHDLIIAGDGPELVPLSRLASDMGISQRVIFLGPTPRDQVAKLFAGCTLLATPSRLEPMGIVNLEAMVAGKPVIATRVGGIPEIVVDGKTGLLVPVDDPAAFSKAILELLANPARRAELGAAGKVRAADFDWGHVTRELRDIYSEAVYNRCAIAPALAPVTGEVA
jgi:glycogen(starch) synthase